MLARPHRQELTSVGAGWLLLAAQGLVGRRVLMVHYLWGDPAALRRLVPEVMHRLRVRVATTLHHREDAALGALVAQLPRGLGRFVSASPVPIVASRALPGPLWYTPTFAV